MDAKLTADIARLDRMTAAELAKETGWAEAAIVLPSTADDLAYRAALEVRAGFVSSALQVEAEWARRTA